MKQRSELFDTTLAVLGADHEFARATCLHLASTGARLLLVGSDEARLLEVDNALWQSELHRLFVSTDPDAIARWLGEADATPRGVVAFDATALAALAGMLRAQGNPRTLPAVLVTASRPGAAPALLEAPTARLNPLRLISLQALSVVSEELTTELAKLAQQTETTPEALLAELFGGSAPSPLFTSHNLGQRIATLLGSFSQFGAPCRFVFDGATPS
jgi:NAD(P)-dependent dehydrogenase (short-subunit alcohol dehydrogenase family)